jgi:hypothetical protein
LIRLAHHVDPTIVDADPAAAHGCHGQVRAEKDPLRVNVVEQEAADEGVSTDLDRLVAGSPVVNLVNMALLTAIKGKNPDAIYVPGYYTEVGLIARQARELGYTGPLLGGDGWDSPELVAIAGAAVEGTFFTNHYSKDDTRPIVVDFVSKFKAKFGSTPDALAALAYDAAQIMFDAIKRAAPVSDFESRPGELRDSVTAYPVRGRPASWRIIVKARDKKGRYYGSYVEFGHNTADGKRVPAQPFFWPTYRARRGKGASGLRARILRPARRLIRAMTKGG